MTFWDGLKNTFLLLVLLNVAPLLVDNIKSQYRTYFVPNTQVGVMSIKGLISDSTPYAKSLTGFFEDKNIKAILIKMESSGGSCGSCQALFNEIVQLKKEHPKPIVTLIENVCTAGGYYIASATDCIIAPGTSIIGSINMHMLCTKNECTELNTSDDPANSTSKHFAIHLRQDAYRQIVEDIARQRKLPVNALQTWAEGNNFTAREALKIGLIDQLGSTHTATQIIKTKTLIEGEIKWINPPTQNSLLGFLGDSGSETDVLGTCAKVLKLMILG